MSKKLIELLLKAKERGCPFTPEEVAEIDGAVSTLGEQDPPDGDPTHPPKP